MCSMTLEKSRIWMLDNPGRKVTCPYFIDEWIMFNGTRFVFENGEEVNAEWWHVAYGFPCKWTELKEL